MRIRKRWLLPFVVPLAILGVYFGWGAILASKYEARLDALRAAGEPVTFEDLLGPPVPAEQNGAALIIEAGEIFEKVDIEFLLRLSAYPDSEEGAERPAGEALPRLALCFDKIEEALRRSVISLPRKGSESHVQFSPFQEAVSALAFRGHFEPTAEIVDTLFDLADHLAQRTFMEVVGKLVTLQEALRVLRRGLERGTIDFASNAARWRAQLRDAESGHEARLLLRFDRVYQIDLFERYRHGEDPFEQAREMLDHANEVIEDFSRSSFRFPERPWYSNWYGHPVLNRRALDALELNAELMEFVDDEAAMRDRIDHFRMTLTFRSTLRLGRVFLAIKQRNEPLPRLEDYFPDSAMPLDALTGKPFLYERTEDGAFIATGDKSSRVDLIEHLLAWEIRYD